MEPQELVAIVGEFNRFFKGKAEIVIEGPDALTVTIGNKVMAVKASRVIGWRRGRVRGVAR